MPVRLTKRANDRGHGTHINLAVSAEQTEP